MVGRERCVRNGRSTATGSSLVVYLTKSLNHFFLSCRPFISFPNLFCESTCADKSDEQLENIVHVDSSCDE